MISSSGSKEPVLEPAPFHGVNTGSNPVGDAFDNLRSERVPENQFSCFYTIFSSLVGGTGNNPSGVNTACC